MASPGNRHCANCIGALSFHRRRHRATGKVVSTTALFRSGNLSAAKLRTDAFVAAAFQLRCDANYTAPSFSRVTETPTTDRYRRPLSHAAHPP